MTAWDEIVRLAEAQSDDRDQQMAIIGPATVTCAAALMRAGNMEEAAEVIACCDAMIMARLRALPGFVSYATPLLMRGEKVDREVATALAERDDRDGGNDA